MTKILKLDLKNEKKSFILEKIRERLRHLNLIKKFLIKNVKV